MSVPTGRCRTDWPASTPDRAPEPKARLDIELVRRGLTRSRARAVALVRGGRVLADGEILDKPSAPVTAGASLEVRSGPVCSGDVGHDYVGRGALKLAGVLHDLAGPTVRGRRCLDAGASTGGFTQVLLRNGAAHVVAVDVGHHQLAAELVADPRVTDLPGTTVRGLAAAAVGPVDLVVADLSFISLRLVLADLAGPARPGGDLLLLVKPQFEVGRGRLGSGGVVRDRRLRHDALLEVARDAGAMGLEPRAARASRFPGPGGNVEYFLWAGVPDPRAPVGGLTEPDLLDAVRLAVEEGPS
jgi:23S rRNA (cytidine1920-2'-O)/16S rRNA (cytidine1409-2'-O)-methyltransferase